MHTSSSFVINSRVNYFGMDTGIEEARKRSSLTAEEDAVVEYEDKTVGRRSEQIALWLWGKLHTEGNANDMKIVFENVWKPSRGVVIRDLDKNQFAFQFFSLAGRDYVLNEGPWAFDGNILSPKNNHWIWATLGSVIHPSQILGESHRCPTHQRDLNLRQNTRRQSGRVHQLWWI